MAVIADLRRPLCRVGLLSKVRAPSERPHRGRARIFPIFETTVYANLFYLGEKGGELYAHVSPVGECQSTHKRTLP